MSSALERIVDLLEELFKKPLSDRCRIFASVLVPGVSMVGCLTFLLVSGPSFQSERSLALTELKTSMQLVDANTVIAEREGLALFAVPSDREWYLPMESQVQGELWTSLDRDLLVANSERIQLSQDGLRLKLPLIGTNEPFVAITSMRGSGEVLSGGRTEVIADFKIRPILPEALPLWSTLSLMLGLGASVGIGTTRPAAEGEQTRGQHSA